MCRAKEWYNRKVLLLLLVLLIVLLFIVSERINPERIIIGSFEGKDTIYVGKGTIVKQSFITTCNGYIEYIELFAAEEGVFREGNIKIYNGKPENGIVTYDQTFKDVTIKKPGERIKIYLSYSFEVTSGKEYTFELFSTLNLIGHTNLYSKDEAYLNNNYISSYDLNFAISVMNLRSSHVKEKEGNAYLNANILYNSNFVSDYLTVRFVDNHNPTVIQLYDVLGNSINIHILDQNKDNISEYNVNVQDLTSGFYLLSVNNGETNKTLRFIKK